MPKRHQHWFWDSPIWDNERSRKSIGNVIVMVTILAIILLAAAVDKLQHLIWM